MIFRLPKLLDHQLWTMKQKLHLQLAQRRMQRIRHFRSGAPHGLPADLVVSLTSYPKRYETLHLTIGSLLDQSVKPDHVVLWLTPSDYDMLPDCVLALESAGLTIATHPVDLRAYGKIIPALEKHPGSFIVTADDDLYYPPDWLADLTRLFDPSDPRIICHRAHRPVFDESGRLRPYSEWTWNYQSTPDDGSLFPTGVGGVLYPPGSLHEAVVNRRDFLSIAPLGDDVWLYFMGHMAGSRYTKVSKDFRELVWPSSQSQSLSSENVGKGRNDQQIRAMEHQFGLLRDLSRTAALGGGRSPRVAVSP